MAESRVAALLEPARHRLVAVFDAASTALVDRGRRLAAVAYTIANAIAFFVTPVAVIALAFGVWRLGSELGWAGEFPISSGPFSHWMVWIALSIGLRASVALLNRPGEGDPPENPTQDTSHDKESGILS